MSAVAAAILYGHLDRLPSTAADAGEEALVPGPGDALLSAAEKVLLFEEASRILDEAVDDDWSARLIAATLTDYAVSGDVSKVDQLPLIIDNLREAADAIEDLSIQKPAAAAVIRAIVGRLEQR